MHSCSQDEADSAFEREVPSLIIIIVTITIIGPDP